jgi:hypothetical protein
MNVLMFLSLIGEPAAFRPASTGVARAGTAAVLHSLDADNEKQLVPPAAGSFEDGVRRILGAS